MRNFIIIVMAVVFGFGFMSCDTASVVGGNPSYDVNISVISGDLSMIEGEADLVLTTDSAFDIGVTFAWTATSSNGGEVTLSTPNDASTLVSAITEGDIVITVTASADGFEDGTDSVTVSVVNTSIIVLESDSWIPSVGPTVTFDGTNYEFDGVDEGTYDDNGSVVTFIGGAYDESSDDYTDGIITINGIDFIQQ